MKSVICVLIALFLVSLNVSAADFSPTVLTITGNNLVIYRFDGQDVNFPISIAGTPASV